MYVMCQSRRAKQNTLVRMRIQQWQDELDEDEGHASSDGMGNSEEHEEADSDSAGMNENQRTSTEEIGCTEQEDIRQEMRTAVHPGGLLQSSAPKRKRGRPPKTKPSALQSQRSDETVSDEVSITDLPSTEEDQGCHRSDELRERIKGETPDPLQRAEEMSDSISSAWGHEVEEVIVDDLLFLVCSQNQQAEFVRNLAEPTFLYAPKKAATRSTGSRSKRQSTRSPTYVLHFEIGFARPTRIDVVPLPGVKGSLLFLLQQAQEHKLARRLDPQSKCPS